MKSIYIAVLLLLACVCYTQGFLVAKKNGTATKEKATKPPKKGNESRSERFDLSV